MPPTNEERPAPDEDRVREQLNQRDSDRADDPAPDDLDKDPAYNPDDPNLKDIKGG